MENFKCIILFTISFQPTLVQKYATTAGVKMSCLLPMKSLNTITPTIVQCVPFVKNALERGKSQLQGGKT